MNAKLVEKISKLLALAGSPNEHEARLAAEKANELLIRHNLSLQDVHAVGEKPGYVKEKIIRGRNFRAEDKFIWDVLVKHFFVKLAVSPGRATLMGTSTNVEVAKYVYDFLALKYRELWHQYADTHDAPATSKQPYYTGLTAGLNAQLSAKRKQVEESMALVVVPDAGLEDFLKENSGRGSHAMARNNHTDWHATASGNEAGKKLSISRGLTTTAAQSGKYLGAK